MSSTPRQTPRPPDVRSRVASALGAVLLAAAVGLVTLGPSGVVADARSAVVGAVTDLLRPWVATVHRAPVEATANALLFLPVGALAARLLRRWSPFLPLLVGVGLSTAVELVQSVLPGRVPDPADVAANAVGTALGVALVVVVRRRHRLSAVLLAVSVALLACVPAVLAGPPSRTGVTPGTSAAAAPAGVPGALTPADGYVGRGESLPPSADVAALTRLDPVLRQAVRDAARAAGAAGVELRVTSGWRSAPYQRELFTAAVDERGGVEAARRFVLPPERSAHVTGRAVDVGPTDATDWLSRHGSDFGLCRVYANESWHFERLVERGGECPALVADAG